MKCRTRFRAQRRGITLLEFAAAAVVIVACCALLAELLFLVARQDKVATTRQVVQRTVANRLEQLAARPWSDLAVGNSAPEQSLPELQQLLPSAELRTQITASEDDAVRRIRVEIHWRDAASQGVQIVGLSAWKHRPVGEEQP